MHTKEPWPAPSGASLNIPYYGITIAEGYCGTEANAARIVSCVNAMAGIPDPQAYVAAFEAMVEAADSIGHAWESALAADLDLPPNLLFNLRTALQAARIARGDA